VIEIEGVKTAEWRLDLLFRSKRYTISAHRPGDVLNFVFAKVQKIEREAVTNLRVDGFGNTYSAGQRQRLQARGDIDAVPHEVGAIHDNVAEIDPDAETACDLLR